MARKVFGFFNKRGDAVLTKTNNQIHPNWKNFRSLPENPQAEKQLFEAILADLAREKFEVLKKSLRLLELDDFSRNLGKQVFSKMKKFHEEKRPFNEFSLTACFENDPNFTPYRDFIEGLNPTTGGVWFHNAELIVEASLRRKLIQSFIAAQEESFNAGASVDEILERAQSTIDTIKARWGRVQSERTRIESENERRAATWN